MCNGSVMCNGGVIMYNDGIKADNDMRQSVYRN